MAGRRSGPPPKSPEERARRNVDPLVGADGWTEIGSTPFAGEVPEIPEWIEVGPTGRAVYEHLSRLPQAAMYGPGTWFQLHMTLPLIERYLTRPGSENYKAITTTLGAALRLTEDDLARARVRVAAPVSEEDASPEQRARSARVASLADRRKRLMAG